jgi:4a-hydroxytetrahydrobiopterin dehydratase
MQLNGMKCEACQAGAPLVSDEAAAEFKQQIPEWSLIEAEGEKRLERVFKFPDFAAALAFTNRVGELAEQNNHHPAILTEWGKVTVQWWTHKINGLHMNDFIMAAQTDQLA